MRSTPMLLMLLAMLWPLFTFAADPTPEQDYQRLRPQLSARAGNPAYDAALGIAALDSGRPVEAIAAFERVLAVQPDNHAIRTELARAYERVGDVAAAKREVDNVRHAKHVPAPVRANLSQHAIVLEDELTGGPFSITGYVHTAVGYDSNVNTASGSSYLLIPAFAFLGPARLEGGLTAAEDMFAEAENGMVLRLPYAPGKQFYASSRVNRRQMRSEFAYNQMAFSGEVGWQAQTPDNGWFGFGASAQDVWFSEEPYSRSYGLYGAWKDVLSPSRAITLYGNYARTAYAQQADRDANRVVGGFSVQQLLSEHARWQPTLFAGAHAGFEETLNGNADFYSHRLVGGSLGIEAYPTAGTALFAQVEYEIRDYSDEYPLFLRSRFDRQVDISAGVAQEIIEGWSVRPRVAWRDASSNIGFYDYGRWMGDVQVRYSF